MTTNKKDEDVTQKLNNMMGKKALQNAIQDQSPSDFKRAAKESRLGPGQGRQLLTRVFKQSIKEKNRAMVQAALQCAPEVLADFEPAQFVNKAANIDLELLGLFINSKNCSNEALIIDAVNAENKAAIQYINNNIHIQKQILNKAYSHALSNKNKALINLLLEYGASPDAGVDKKVGFHSKVLEPMLTGNGWERVQYIIRKTNIIHDDKYCFPPSLVVPRALAAEQYKLIDYLNKNGVTIDYNPTEQYYSLSSTHPLEVLFEQCRTKNISVTKPMLKKAVDIGIELPVNGKQFQKDILPISTIEAVKHLTSEYGLSFDDTLDTIFYQIATDIDAKKIDVLFDSAIDKNKNTIKRTWGCVVYANDKDTVQAFINQYDIPDLNKKIPCFYAKESQTPLFLAIAGKARTEVVQCLVEHGAVPTSVHLREAVDNNYPGVVDILLDYNNNLIAKSESEVVKKIINNDDLKAVVLNHVSESALLAARV